MVLNHSAHPMLSGIKAYYEVPGTVYPTVAPSTKLDEDSEVDYVTRKRSNWLSTQPQDC